LAYDKSRIEPCGGVDPLRNKKKKKKEIAHRGGTSNIEAPASPARMIERESEG
jgi:hypothetical protein